jgi:hypothetical protein
LNEILAGCAWTPEVSKAASSEIMTDTEATEDELQLVLAGKCCRPSHASYCLTSIGKVIPQKIPVNVFLPSMPIVTDPLFETPDATQLRRPRIVMTSPERPPISGLVEITIAYDETRPRGITVELSGAMSCDIKLEVLEEICRRGGTLGLPGRIWSNSLA